MRKSLGNRHWHQESAVRGNGGPGFSSVQRAFSFLNSSGVFYLSKGYGNRAPSEITFYPLTSPWAGLIVENLWQIALNKFWLHSRLVPLAIAQCLLGPSWAVVLWASPDHVTCLALGLLQMAFCGLLLVCHNLGKKWASTLFKKGSNCVKFFAVIFFFFLDTIQVEEKLNIVSYLT